MVTYDVTFPFIRMVADPVDYTQGAMRNATRANYRPVNSEPMSQGTRCRQLATYVIFESPLNMLCDNPTNYMREKNVPNLSQTSRPFGTKHRCSMQKYPNILLYCQHDDIWYLGALTNWEPREMELDLSFLGDGDYKLELFKDGINADRAACDYKKKSSRFPPTVS